VQINDRYEFPEELDLDREDGKYLSENADRSIRNKYRLHSVLVHSGGIHGGHYYAYCNPSGSQWLKFDDDKVCSSSFLVYLTPSALPPPPPPPRKISSKNL
jgi:ubiquitin carboxyl-terminal hydrolase 7